MMEAFGFMTWTVTCGAWSLKWMKGNIVFKPTFRIRNNDDLYLTEKYICNGHWMMKREHAKLKGFKRFLDLKHGTYHFGSFTSDRVRELDQLIPKRDNYRPMPTAKPHSVIWGEKHFGQINGYIYEVPAHEREVDTKDGKKTENVDAFKIGVSIDYVLLMDGYHAFAVNNISPILLLDGPTLNDDLVGVIMPMRIK